MKILGIVGSHRRLGNTDCLVREALIGARDKGADVETIRLTDLNIRPCKGCMMCAFRMEECKIKDDMVMLLDKMQEADGIVLGAPTYVLAPQGQVKLVMDRALMLVRRLGDWGEKRGSTIGVAGHPEWAELMMPSMNYFMFVMNADLVDSMIAYGPGPGQVLLEKENIEKANRLGSNLAAAAGDGLDDDDKLPLVGDACPICRTDLLRIVGPRIECPVCKVEGDIGPVDGKLRITWDKDAHTKHRWTPENRAHHINDWVLGTEDMYKARKREIAKLRARYKDFQQVFSKGGPT